MLCPLTEVRGHDRAVHFTYGNTTFYSVPESTLLFIQCKDFEFSHKAIRNSTRVNGQGEASFGPVCSITTTNNTNWRAPSIHMGTNLSDKTDWWSDLRWQPDPRTELMSPTENISLTVRVASFAGAILLAGLLGWWIRKAIKKADFCWGCCLRVKTKTNDILDKRNSDLHSEILT